MNEKITINGKTYESFEALPNDLKKKFDKNNNQKIDLFEQLPPNMKSWPLYDLSSVEGKEALKQVIKKHFDPVKLAGIDVFIRGVLLILVLGAMVVYGLSMIQ